MEGRGQIGGGRHGEDMTEVDKSLLGGARGSEERGEGGQRPRPGL